METFYKDKYFSILGDSISTFEGYTEPKDAVYYDKAKKIETGVLTLADTWWGNVIERLGGKLLVNNSWSGSTVCNHPSFEVPSYACSTERTSSLDKDGIAPAVILVFMGTNDWGMGFRVTDSQGKSTTVFSVAYREMLTRLKENYPNAEIWCMTLPISQCSQRENFTFTFCSNGRHIGEYCEAISESAKEKNCHIIDLYSYGRLHDTIDGCHPNVDGMKTLANAVLEALTNTGKKVEEKRMQTANERWDKMYVEALEYVVKEGKVTISFIQRRCKVGYNRGGKILEWMEEQGYVSPFDGEKPREVFATVKDVEILKEKLKKGEGIGREEEVLQKCAYEIIYGSEDLK